MNGIARNFFTLAIIYSLVGMSLGLHMAMSQDHAQTADPCAHHGCSAG